MDRNPKEKVKVKRPRPVLFLTAEFMPQYFRRLSSFPWHYDFIFIHILGDLSRSN
jgi:hypothetical protein